jgi:hypothetical protein
MVCEKLDLGRRRTAARIGGRGDGRKEARSRTQSNGHCNSIPSFPFEPHDTHCASEHVAEVLADQNVSRALTPPASRPSAPPCSPRSEVTGRRAALKATFNFRRSPLLAAFPKASWTVATATSDRSTATRCGVSPTRRHGKLLELVATEAWSGRSSRSYSR